MYIQTILYGAEESVLFPGLRWGGMTADPAIYAQTALQLPDLLQDWGEGEQDESWRIFSKLGESFVETETVSLSFSIVYIYYIKYIDIQQA